MKKTYFTNYSSKENGIDICLCRFDFAQRPMVLLDVIFNLYIRKGNTDLIHRYFFFGLGFLQFNQLEHDYKPRFLLKIPLKDKDLLRLIVPESD